VEQQISAEAYDDVRKLGCFCAI